MRSLKILLLSVATFTTLSASSLPDGGSDAGMGNPALSTVAADQAGEPPVESTINADQAVEEGDNASSDSSSTTSGDDAATGQHSIAFASLTSATSAMGDHLDIIAGYLSKHELPNPETLSEAFKQLCLLRAEILAILTDAQAGGCPAAQALVARDRSSTNVSENGGADGTNTPRAQNDGADVTDDGASPVKAATDDAAPDAPAASANPSNQDSNEESGTGSVPGEEPAASDANLTTDAPVTGEVEPDATAAQDGTTTPPAQVGGSDGNDDADTNTEKTADVQPAAADPVVSATDLD